MDELVLNEELQKELRDALLNNQVSTEYEIVEVPQSELSSIMKKLSKHWVKIVKKGETL